MKVSPSHQSQICNLTQKVAVKHPKKKENTKRRWKDRQLFSPPPSPPTTPAHPTSNLSHGLSNLHRSGHSHTDSFRPSLLYIEALCNLFSNVCLPPVLYIFILNEYIFPFSYLFLLSYYLCFILPQLAWSTHYVHTCAMKIKGYSILFYNRKRENE